MSAGTDPTGPLKVRSAVGSLSAIPARTPGRLSEAAEFQQSRSVGTVVACATVIASEVLADFLDSLAEAPIPTKLKVAALRAAASSNTDSLLALPMQLSQAVSAPCSVH